MQTACHARSGSGGLTHLVEQIVARRAESGHKALDRAARTGRGVPAAPVIDGASLALRVTHRTLRAGFRFVLLGGLILSQARPAAALDKQGSAHGGQVGGGEGGFNVSGGLMLGSALVNPTYAARPDNTGLMLLRYALHVDVDLLGPLLSIPIDVNMVTDRLRGGAAMFAPSELDLITGLTSTHTLGRATAFELGTRVEHDRPVDRDGLTQTYVDARARLLYSLGAVWPSLKDGLADGDITGYGTLGWFIYNPSYAARPDNTGRALFRYVAHNELSVWHQHIGLGVDGTFFTDRQGDNPIAPTELDFTTELIGRYQPFELHIAYERDMPVDRGGLVQSLLYALASYSFDFRSTLHPAQPKATQ